SGPRGAAGAGHAEHLRARRASGRGRDPARLPHWSSVDLGRDAAAGGHRRTCRFECGGVPDVSTAGIVAAVGHRLSDLTVASNVIPAQPDHCLRGHVVLDHAGYDGGALPDASRVSGPELDARLFSGSTYAA